MSQNLPHFIAVFDPGSSAPRLVGRFASSNGAKPLLVAIPNAVAKVSNAELDAYRSSRSTGDIALEDDLIVKVEGEVFAIGNAARHIALAGNNLARAKYERGGIQLLGLLGAIAESHKLSHFSASVLTLLPHSERQDLKTFSTWMQSRARKFSFRGKTVEIALNSPCRPEGWGILQRRQRERKDWLDPNFRGVILSLGYRDLSVFKRKGEASDGEYSKPLGLSGMLEFLPDSLTSQPGFLGKLHRIGENFDLDNADLGSLVRAQWIESHRKREIQNLAEMLRTGRERHWNIIRNFLLEEVFQEGDRVDEQVSIGGGGDYFASELEEFFSSQFGASTGPIPKLEGQVRFGLGVRDLGFDRRNSAVSARLADSYSAFEVYYPKAVEKPPAFPAKRSSKAKSPQQSTAN